MDSVRKLIFFFHLIRSILIRFYLFVCIQLPPLNKVMSIKNPTPEGFSPRASKLQPRARMVCVDKPTSCWIPQNSIRPLIFIPCLSSRLFYKPLPFFFLCLKTGLKAGGLWAFSIAKALLFSTAFKDGFQFGSNPKLT